MKISRNSLNWWIPLFLLLMTGGNESRLARAANQNSDHQLAVLDRDPPKYLTDRNFRRVLVQPFSASWSNVGIRAILQRIQSTQNISIILDRRIDPSLKLTIDTQNLSLEAGLEKIASEAHAQIGIVGSNIYIGPAQAVANLMTLLELKQEELQNLSASRASLKSRVLFLSRKKTFHYQDLETPAEILKQITDAYQLTLTDPKQIPHDLWANGSLTAVNANQALSLVLIQLGFTFQWEQQGRQIQLEPVPEIVTIKKTYQPRKGSVSALITQLKQAFPDLTVVPSGKSITIQASIEVHEKIEQLLNPTKTLRSPKPVNADAVPIQRRKFTLRVKQVPLLAIMNKLEQSGIEFDYNASQLKSAGIDLNKLIDVTVKDAKPPEFFDALFSPLNLDYQIQGTKVILTPK
ncbi:hypothetical protein Pan241w_23630 [Gimesia alba]|uniref:Uncharacterized protein n=1 Tax=Gimesia alba TaxID=2527973 RepID=A0A517REK5_9PLAN|nr:STN domain-containing protein [Gimesia alba]QDT42280.1 hypothetical protein Pan241w_23630 [Gimesia alba]